MSWHVSPQPDLLCPCPALTDMDAGTFRFWGPSMAVRRKHRENAVEVKIGLVQKVQIASQTLL